MVFKRNYYKYHRLYDVVEYNIRQIDLMYILNNNEKTALLTKSM